MSRFRWSYLLGLCLVALSAAVTVAQGPAKGPAAGSKEERALLLQTVGLMSASHLYQAYLNIGAIADGKANGVYEEKDAQAVMDSVYSLIVATDRQLDAVSRLDLPKGDLDALTRVRQLSALVREQADEVKAYWKTGQKERADRYEKLRQQSYQGISQLLGLEK